jgi:hypothetical protein
LPEITIAGVVRFFARTSEWNTMSVLGKDRLLVGAAGSNMETDCGHEKIADTEC